MDFAQAWQNVQQQQQQQQREQQQQQQQLKDMHNQKASGSRTRSKRATTEASESTKGPWGFSASWPSWPEAKSQQEAPRQSWDSPQWPKPEDASKEEAKEAVRPVKSEAVFQPNIPSVRRPASAGASVDARKRRPESASSPRENRMDAAQREEATRRALKDAEFWDLPAEDFLKANPSRYRFDRQSAEKIITRYISRRDSKRRRSEEKKRMSRRLNQGQSYAEHRKMSPTDFGSAEVRRADREIGYVLRAEEVSRSQEDPRIRSSARPAGASAHSTSQVPSPSKATESRPMQDSPRIPKIVVKQPTSEAQRASLHIQKPFSEVSKDLDSFSVQFVKAAALATGVEAQRIRIRGIRPGGTAPGAARVIESPAR
eukprot:TRINITY_DN10613_c0_g1_i1.p1 TRINITY_DN10613_c0_g1~~TRINITY_DN10613_c0_g1_i1.p1  ORF type:complete len:430 (+),score=108.57 TRINITY_DN10613_c0_g1_i1:177-1292(+)